MRSLSPLGVLAFLAIAGLARAQTIVVSGGGAALQQAINAAPVGATLDVMPGTYSPVAVTQGLHISLRPGAAVSAPFPSMTPGMTISALPVGQHVVLEGSGRVTSLAIDQCAGDVVVNGVNHATGLGGTQPSTVSGCTGAVMFQRTTSVLGGIAWGSIQVSASPHVSFTACSLPTMVVTLSRVSINQSSNAGAFGAGPGIDVVSGSVVVDGGSIEGATWPNNPTFPFPAPGIRLAQGEVVVTGGAVIRYSPTFTLPSPAIWTTGGSVRLDPSVQLIGTTYGPATIQTGEIPSLIVSHSATVLSVAVTGEPGSTLFTIAGPPTSPVGTPWGDAWLSPLDPIVDVVLLPPSGMHGSSLQFANVPAFVSVVVQSVALTTTGALVIGAPARCVWD